MAALRPSSGDEATTRLVWLHRPSELGSHQTSNQSFLLDIRPSCRHADRKQNNPDLIFQAPFQGNFVILCRLYEVAVGKYLKNSQTRRYAHAWTVVGEQTRVLGRSTE